MANTTGHRRQLKKHSLVDRNTINQVLRHKIFQSICSLYKKFILLMAAQVNRFYPIQLVDGDGNFNTNIEQVLNLANENGPMASVSVMGVQSTGKSTLLNKCFSTGFQVMDAMQGRNQTTKGIWIAKWTSSNDGQKILVIDTEGSDGAEREDDLRFEKQTALFALAISNTVIFNMKCDSVNLRNGASQPLLQTVFEVMVRKFSTPRKVNLVFVLRDKDESPLGRLKEQLIGGMHKMWKEKIKTQAQGNVNAALEDYFNIEVMAMSHYRYEEEQFNTEVANLRERIISYSTSRRLEIAASGFADYARKTWDEIKEDKILNLQLNMITIAEVYCIRIAEKKHQNFAENESWLQIKRDVMSGEIVKGFGNNVSLLIETHLSEYDVETLYFDETKSNASKKQLTEKLLQAVEPTYLFLVEQMRLKTLGNFQEAAVDELKRTGELVAIQTQKFITEFRDQLPDVTIRQANWSHASTQLTRLESEIASYIEGVRAMNERLKEQKESPQDFWTKYAGSIVSAAVGTILAPAVAARDVFSTFLGTILAPAIAATKEE